jgi:ATP-dependent protease HslVU (ClpYQ) peptidase subunit
MSCIVGVVSGGKVYMGGDSAGVNSQEHLQLETAAKVFTSGQHLIIGMAGSPLASQKIRYADILESWVSDAHKTMSKVVIPSLEYHLKDLEFDMLVGLGGRLFHVYSNFQFAEEQIGFDAAGSGAQVARGAMYSMYHLSPSQDWWNGKCLNMALDAASRFCSGVRGPYTILSR